MRKIVSFMHITLDGFVGKPNWEDFSWPKVDEEIFALSSQQTAQSDTAIYGRVTFEGMDAYWPTAAEQPGATEHDIVHSRWYNQVEKVVLSRTLSSDPKRKIRVISEDVAGAIHNLKQQPGQDMVIFGSPSVVHTLMAHDLIDEYCLMLNPYLLGEGIPMFKHIQKSELKLLQTKVFENGAVFLRYGRVG